LSTMVYCMAEVEMCGMRSTEDWFNILFQLRSSLYSICLSEMCDNLAVNKAYNATTGYQTI